ncbi:MAG: hypothetical protein GDA50_00085 [Alphaproteobacteria bacterium GM202ARS2]|nr:hypothetical protein [Alphaproteobacteria bacterium GM202ARS2]
MTEEQFGKQFALRLATRVQRTRKGKKKATIAVVSLSKGAGQTLQGVLDKCIPDDWIRKSNAVGRLITGKIDDVKQSRYIWASKGVFREIRDILIHDGDSVMTVYDKIASVNVHEFAHRLQKLYPDLDMMFQSIVRRRLRDGGKFIDSQYADLYPQKGYIEALPLSLERLLGQHFDYLRDRPELEVPVWGQKEFLEKDPELAYLTIGVLLRWKE